MPSLIDEHQVFLDSSGTPIVSGKIYIGSQNNDPVTNPITIYSDRDLTTALPNPQPTDVNGRALNKIWVPAKYSIRVDDSDDVQQYQNLDAGDTSETGITNLTNVAGTDTITAEGTPAILALVDNQQYNFRAAAANTGPVTLQIDLTAAKSILKQHDVALAAGDIEANQTVSVIYNATDDAFELVSNIALNTVSTTHIQFPATQVPNADVNALDDYEEGTWVATLTLGGGTASLYATAETLSYTKIGQHVYVTGRLTIETVGTPSGSITINGLPFTAATSTDQETVSYFPAYVNGTTGTTVAPGNWWDGRVDSAATTIDIYDEGTPGGDHLQANTNIYLNFHYIAA